MREVGGAQTGLFGEGEMVVAKVKRFGAADSTRIVIAHERSADGIGGDRVQADDEDARSGEEKFVCAGAPGAFAAAHGGDPVDNREMDRASGADIDDGAGHTPGGFGGELLLLYIL